MARELIEAARGRADEAARIAEAVRRPGPTVEAAITEHITAKPQFSQNVEQVLATLPPVTW